MLKVQLELKTLKLGTLSFNSQLVQQECTSDCLTSRLRKCIQ